MSPSSQSTVPAAALNWLVGAAPRRVLNLGGETAGLSESIAAAGHPVVQAARDASRLCRGHPSVVAVAAQAESLPFDPCTFDVVVASQVFHTFAPGLALSEIARVLVPGGCLSLMYIVRDDSVPWVGKLRDLLQAADPSAMSGSYGSNSIDRVKASAYFPHVEFRGFRIWTPIARPGLLAMVAKRAEGAHVADDRREQLLRDVGRLYDAYARSPEPLLLPYKASCWRAFVDHSELTAPIVAPDDGLTIPLTRPGREAARR